MKTCAPSWSEMLDDMILAIAGKSPPPDKAAFIRTAAQFERMAEAADFWNEHVHAEGLKAIFDARADEPEDAPLTPAERAWAKRLLAEVSAGIKEEDAA